MTYEEKQLLLIDLCARLPYGVYAELPHHHLVRHTYLIESINMRNGLTEGILHCAGRKQIYAANVEDVKPYLRPMSSMTEDELWEFRHFSDYIRDTECKIHIANYKQIDWLNANHFDYRRIYDEDKKKWMSMIEKGLAIEAPNNMYKEE